jgi:hypothetical protein
MVYGNKMNLKIFAETNLFNAGTSFEDKKLSYEQADKLESTIKKNLEHLDFELKRGDFGQ